MGLVDIILGIKISMISSKCHYMDKIIKNSNKYNSRIAKTLIEVNL